MWVNNNPLESIKTGALLNMTDDSFHFPVSSRWGPHHNLRAPSKGGSFPWYTRCSHTNSQETSIRLPAFKFPTLKTYKLIGIFSRGNCILGQLSRALCLNQEMGSLLSFSRFGFACGVYLGYLADWLLLLKRDWACCVESHWKPEETSHENPDYWPIDFFLITPHNW